MPRPASPPRSWHWACTRATGWRCCCPTAHSSSSPTMVACGPARSLSRSTHFMSSPSSSINLPTLRHEY